MSHNIRTSLAKSNSPEMKRWWDCFFRSASETYLRFDDLQNDRKMQDLGVDVRVHHSDGMRLLTELKAEGTYRAAEILIEFISVYRDTVEKLGWVTKLGNSDRLAVGWPSVGRGFLIDSATLALAWEENTRLWQHCAAVILAYQAERGRTKWDFPSNQWIREQVGQPVGGNRFRFVEAHNTPDFGKPYVTSSLVVPVSELVRCGVDLKAVRVRHELLN